MKAVVFISREKGAEYQANYSCPEIDNPPDGYVKVDLTAAALNKRDDFILKGKYPGIRPNVILGSDGAGLLNGKRVFFNPGINWGDDEAVQSVNYHILGVPTHGTFASSVLVPKENVFFVPNHLNFVEAAALPLAGLTAFRALFTRGELKSGEKILVTGGGGGVAQMCIQFAVAVGAQVYSTTGSTDKFEQLEKLGVAGVKNYNTYDWDKELLKSDGPFDLIIDSAGGDGFQKLISLLKPGGRMVIYGGTHGKAHNVSPQIIFWRQLNILGSTMGSPSDFESMVEFIDAHKIKPVIDNIYPLEDFRSAFDRINSGKHFGKIVLRIN